jgi:hypothetical protein
MAALGANYHYDREKAFHLHRAARLSIINHVSQRLLLTEFYQ